VNGIDCAEATLYGAYAGSLGVPVLMLSGDDQLHAQCRQHFPEAKFAVVKHALSNRAARALSPEAARARIRAAATEAVRNHAACRPFVIPPPHRLELDLTSMALADYACSIPVAERVSPRTVAFQADSMTAVIGWVAAISTLSSVLRT
jgi:D-amino peptidase